MVRELISGLCLALVLAAPAAAQTPADTLPADTIPRESNAPRNALIKSLLVPGLGQFSIGSPVRGALWVGVRGSSYYMLAKTLKKLGEAKDRETGYREVAAADLRAQMEEDTVLARQLSDPLAFEERLAADSTVSAAHDLVESRTRHRQDWITYTIFFTFLDGLDAYVAAHLRDFPGEITTTPGLDGSVSLRVDMPVTGRRRR